MVFVITLLIAGCRTENFKESHVITDPSKPVSFFYTLKSNPHAVGYKLKGSINGTLGYYEANCRDKESFLSLIDVDNLSKLDSATLHQRVWMIADSVKTERNSSGGQKGTMYCLHFIPGTATEGKIEVEFWEHPRGFF